MVSKLNRKKQSHGPRNQSEASEYKINGKLQIAMEYVVVSVCN